MSGVTGAIEGGAAGYVDIGQALPGAVRVEMNLHVQEKKQIMSTDETLPMVDLRANYRALKSSIDAAVADVLEKTNFIMGEKVKAFEAEAAEHLGCAHAIGCANGTDALQLALMALELQPGDEVLTTPFTFIATAEAIMAVGAVPVFVDIDPVTYNMDVSLAARKIGPRTKALLPVHLFGQPTDMLAIRELATAHDLRIVEDCAQSFGALYDGKATGTLGDIGCFSFFPSKNLGAFGDGGMVTTDDDELAVRLRMFRAHGSERRYHHKVVGCNSRLDEIQAAILRVKLPHIEGFNEARRAVAAAYDERLRDLPLQRPPLAHSLGGVPIRPVFHQYTLVLEDREALREALDERRIASAVYYPIPLHRQEAFAGMPGVDERHPVTERVAERCLSLPIFPELSTEQIERVTDVVRSVVAVPA